MSISAPPPGSSISSRRVVGGGPLSSVARTSAVACRSSPSRRLVSVDLPAPDEPSSTAVLSGASIWAERVQALALLRADRQHGDAGGDRAQVAQRGIERRVRVQVGLVDDDDRVDAPGRGERQVALDPARVHVAPERGDDPGLVDVCGQRGVVAAALDDPSAPGSIATMTSFPTST